MKIYELLEYVDELQENCFSDKVKLRWINQVEAEIQTEVLLLDIHGIRQYTIADREAELLVPPPYDQIYQEYLFYQIALAQGETERANNQMEVFNRAYTDYVRFVAQTINPGDGCADRRRYYLTAYQIAVKYGYTGTEEQWIKEVAGPPGPPGTDGKDGKDGRDGTDGKDGQDGDDGGYYTPSITQPDANTMRISLTPSDSSMPAIAPVNVTLPAGPKGETGNGFAILGYYDTLALLEAAKPTPEPGDAYGVGSAEPYDIYIWDGENQTWVNNGTIQGAQGLPGQDGTDGTDGKDGQDGDDGGYYTPSITQPDANTMRISLTPSDAAMPAVEDVDVTLPEGPAGQGDMIASAYDPTGEVAAAGGIAEYIEGIRSIVEDLDTAADSGTYGVNSTTLNRPSDITDGMLQVIRSSNTSVLQILTGSNGYRCRRVTTSYPNWPKWEWENPPLVSGTEYTTTERLNGETVFAMRKESTQTIELTSGGSMSYWYYPNTDVKKILRALASITADNGNIVQLPYYNPEVGSYFTCYWSNSGHVFRGIFSVKSDPIFIPSDGSTAANMTFNVIMYYTKQ